VIMTESKQETRQKPGNTLSIADSARRDVEATLQLLAERAQYITGASGAAIALRNGNRVLCRASSGSASPELGSYLDLSSGLSGECVRTRTLLSCGDTANDPRVDRESCRRLGIASLAVMPILRNDSVIGIFEIFSNRANTFHERDLLALERLQDMVNIALDQAAPDAPTAAPFAVHGTKVKVLAVAAGAGSAAKSTIVADQDADGLHDRLGFIDGLPGTTAAARPDRSKPVERIRSCTSCGFPVSEGRVLCLDCESKGSQARGTGFLAPPSPQPQKGIKSWILTNRYIIGMVLISAATIAFALLH
jgi:GAF domain